MRAIIIALEGEKGEGTDYLSIRVRASFVRFARHFGARLIRYARALLVSSIRTRPPISSISRTFPWTRDYPSRG